MGRVLGTCTSMLCHSLVLGTIHTQKAACIVCKRAWCREMISLLPEMRRHRSSIELSLLPS